MRAVVFGLIGAVLAVGGAEAGECRAGRMAFVSGDKSFSVVDASTTRRRFQGLGAERTIFRGTLGGKPYIVDIQGVQGSSTAFMSYAGRRVEKTALKPAWGSEPSAWSDGSPMMVETGPLAGQWRATCH